MVAPVGRPHFVVTFYPRAPSMRTGLAARIMWLVHLPANRRAVPTRFERWLADGEQDLYRKALKEFDRFIIGRAMRHTDGNQARAADRLGLIRITVRNKLRSLSAKSKSDAPQARLDEISCPIANVRARQSRQSSSMLIARTTGADIRNSGPVLILIWSMTELQTHPGWQPIGTR